MSKIEIFNHFLSQASAKVLRSSTLGSLAWMMVILISAILLAESFFKPHLFIIIIFVIFCCLIILLFIFAYIYFMFKDPDALRSEIYSIQKLAIEKGLVGDNLLGILEREDVEKIKITGNEEKEE